MQSLRDNPKCASEEYERIDDPTDPGLHVDLTFDPSQDTSAPYINTGRRPRVAILREQGVNGQVEMAAAFNKAGFECVDVHMSDLISKRVSLAGFRGLAACGGFSYGDVLGAGQGWAKSILFNPYVRDQFQLFFNRSDTFTLGICNGCQAVSNLAELIPGAEHWPGFVQNLSEQFEARMCQVEVQPNPSILLSGMVGSRLPIVVAHGEGRAEFKDDEGMRKAESAGIIALRFVDNYDKPTHHYPENPNGSPGGITGLSSSDGRVTIMMPHPERLFRSIQHSWRPEQWTEDAPWMRLFRNARAWVD